MNNCSVQTLLDIVNFVVRAYARTYVHMQLFSGGHLRMYVCFSSHDTPSNYYYYYEPHTIITVLVY